jgi:kinetochore protein Mis13/DSN1
MAGTSEGQARRGKSASTAKSKAKQDLGIDQQRTPSPKRGADITKIALPFADTPVMRRNKEMRKGGGDGSRRSSLSMRGRRASSLIDSGTSNGECEWSLMF